MSQWQATLLVGVLALLGNALTTAYFYGRLTERVAGLKEKVDRHETRLDDHGHRIVLLETKKHS